MHPPLFRLISWNVAGRIGCLNEQITAIAENRPDVVALQEVTIKTVSRLIEGLESNGLIHSTDSYNLAADISILTGPRRYGQIIASRWPLTSMPPDLLRIPWTERVLSAVIDSPWGPVEAHTTHIPPGVSNGWTKIEMLEGIYKRLACQCDLHRILCGDFNAPQEELEDGYTVTFGQEIMPDGSVIADGRWTDPQGRSDTMERWDAGERGIIRGLSRFDLIDVFRSINGYGVQEYSWYWKGRGRKIGRRFDHIFASRSLRPLNCRYIHDVRDEGLSDHSAIVAEFDPN
jgi:exonuclease III